jgi:hypothetical protein
MQKLLKLANDADARERQHHAFRYGFFKKLSECRLTGEEQARAFRLGGDLAARHFAEKQAMAGLAMKGLQMVGKGLQYGGTKLFGLGKKPGGWTQRQGDRMARTGLSMQAAPMAGQAAGTLGQAAWKGTKGVGRHAWNTVSNPYFAAGSLATPVASAAGRAMFGGGEKAQPGQAGEVSFTPEQLQMLSQMFGGASPGMMMQYGLQGR